MNHDPSSNPEPIQPVRVKRHRVDWEASDLDLADITGQRALTLAPQIATGCWFLNPRYTVSAPAPTAEFFRTVLRLRSTWLRTCRQVMGNSGQRCLARQAERRGKLASLLTDGDEGEDTALLNRPNASIQSSEVSPEQKREARGRSDCQVSRLQRHHVHRRQPHPPSYLATHGRRPAQRLARAWHRPESPANTGSLGWDR